MEVYFTFEQEAEIAQVANDAGTEPELFVQCLVLSALETKSVPVAPPSGGVVARMRALRSRLKPDPEGWTTRDYVRQGLR